MLNDDPGEYGLQPASGRKSEGISFSPAHHDTQLRAVQSRPIAVGDRFDETGCALPLRGNTIIAPIPPQSALMQELTDLQSRLRKLSVAKCLGFLPPPSFHVTIFDGVIDTNRSADVWPGDLAIDTPLTLCDRQFLQKLKRFDLGCQLPLRFKLSDMQMGLSNQNGLVLNLTPFDVREEAKIRGLRDRLSEQLAHRLPNHMEYQFHLTVAYLIDWIGHAEMAEGQDSVATAFAMIRAAEPAIELHKVEFCLFDDICAFHPKFVWQAPDLK